MLLAHDEVRSRPAHAPPRAVARACRSWRLSNAGALLDRVRSAGAAGGGGPADVVEVLKLCSRRSSCAYPVHAKHGSVVNVTIFER